MRRSVVTGFALCLIVMASSCTKTVPKRGSENPDLSLTAETDTPIGPTTAIDQGADDISEMKSDGEDEEKRTITLADEDGKELNVPLKKDTVLCLMATWCPFCRQFRDFLNDNEVVDYFRDVKFVFIFDDEWPTVRSMAEAEGLEGEELNQKIKDLQEDVSGAKVFDPTFLDDLPGMPYYNCARSGIVHDGGVPAVIDNETLSISITAGMWLLGEERVPRDVLLTVWKRHSPTASDDE